MPSRDFTGFEKKISAAGIPSDSSRSSSAVEAISKPQPSCASTFRTRRSGFLDGVVRPHAGHGRAEASRLAAHDGGVDDQERSGVSLTCCLAHDLEVEADLRMRVEELFLRLLPGYCGLSAAEAIEAVPHLNSPKNGN